MLARSVRGAEGTYRRTYPSGSLFAQTIGYAYTDLTQTGIERYRNTALNGETSATNLQAILDQLQGKRRQGDEVLTTLDPSAQRTAIAALGEHSGAVVALDPRDGAVKVMASSPSYDPNTLSSPSSYERLAHKSSAPLLNRAAAIRLRPRLDLQDRHGDRGDRHGAVHAVLDAQRAQRPAGLRGAAGERLRRKLWRADAHRRRSPNRSTPSGRRWPNTSASGHWPAT